MLIGFFYSKKFVDRYTQIIQKANFAESFCIVIEKDCFLATFISVTVMLQIAQQL